VMGNIFPVEFPTVHANTGLEFRGFWFRFPVRYVFKFFCSQIETITSVKGQVWECEEYTSPIYGSELKLTEFFGQPSLSWSPCHLGCPRLRNRFYRPGRH
jgi:hypothetical protein